MDRLKREQEKETKSGLAEEDNIEYQGPGCVLLHQTMKGNKFSFFFNTRFYLIILSNHSFFTE
ncbi:hypothetical protein DK846_11200 [Methanospirillum lacunae]|uniref:Uncharacterized protein n=1 Tax=Methanospirillum lacunae TaxID=668570 RepID=A0A2V2MT99_9EURY|nr:hypothetical protein DK846_11200 [Methanospirillum lacunae]